MNGIIVEDELPAKEELQFLIETYSSIKITDTFTDGLEVLKFLQENETDVIFLDINIPSLDGMLLASNISKFKKKPYIIFTTAYKQHAAQAFELNAFDYILKPYDEKRIAAVLKRLETAYQRDRQPAAATKPSAALHKRTRINLKKMRRLSSQTSTISIMPRPVRRRRSCLRKRSAIPSTRASRISTRNCRKISSSAATALILSICPKSTRLSSGSIRRTYYAWMTAMRKSR